MTDARREEKKLDLGHDHGIVGSESVTGRSQGQDLAEEARRKRRRVVVEGQRGKGRGQRRGQGLRRGPEGGVQAQDHGVQVLLDLAVRNPQLFTL